MIKRPGFSPLLLCDSASLCAFTPPFCQVLPSLWAPLSTSLSQAIADRWQWWDVQDVTGLREGQTSIQDITIENNKSTPIWSKMIETICIDYGLTTYGYLWLQLWIRMCTPLPSDHPNTISKRDSAIAHNTFLCQGLLVFGRSHDHQGTTCIAVGSFWWVATYQKLKLGATFHHLGSMKIQALQNRFTVQITPFWQTKHVHVEVRTCFKHIKDKNMFGR